jgi:cobalt/nickel transport system permease protein
MHIPDGFLSAPVAVACAALSVTAVGASARRSAELRGSRAVASMGVTAAFIFAAQLVNFPVAGGTSGHLIGGVLAAVLLGPSAAVLVMTAVLTMQCLVFGDGGLLSLGANVFNMAVIHPILGFVVYRVVLGVMVRHGRPGDAARVAAVAFASWVATVVAAATCAGELALSGVAAPGLVLLTMVGVHLAVGLGEALITGLVIATILRLDASLLDRSRVPESPGRRSSIAVLGFSASVGLALFLSPFACSWPDALAAVVERLGITPAHARVFLPAPMRDYAIPGMAGSPWAASLAAGVGTLLAFGLCCAIGFCLTRRRASPDRNGGTERYGEQEAAFPRRS